MLQHHKSADSSWFVSFIVTPLSEQHTILFVCLTDCLIDWLIVYSVYLCSVYEHWMSSQLLNLRQGETKVSGCFILLKVYWRALVSYTLCEICFRNVSRSLVGNYNVVITKLKHQCFMITLTLSGWTAQEMVASSAVKVTQRFIKVTVKKCVHCVCM